MKIFCATVPFTLLLSKLAKSRVSFKHTFYFSHLSLSLDPDLHYFFSLLSECTGESLTCKIALCKWQPFFLSRCRKTGSRVAQSPWQPSESPALWGNVMFQRDKTSWTSDKVHQDGKLSFKKRKAICIYVFEFSFLTFRDSAAVGITQYSVLLMNNELCDHDQAPVNNFDACTWNIIWINWCETSNNPFGTSTIDSRLHCVSAIQSGQ